MNDTPNVMELRFSSRSENESLARAAVAAFLLQIDPTYDEIMEMKTVVSEAVTNAIIHGYEEDPGQFVTVQCSLTGTMFVLVVEDQGRGITDVDVARQPMYTSKPELERSGMGFTIMEEFMDHLEVTSLPGQGTRVRLSKQFQIAEQTAK